MVVTDRFDIDTVWVIEGEDIMTPNNSDSVVVTGENLSSDDRMMIVDCESTCGASSPSNGARVTSAADTCQSSLDQYSTLSPNVGLMGSLQFEGISFNDGGK